MKIVNNIFVGSLTGKTEKEQKKLLDKFVEENKKAKLKAAVSPNLVNKDFIKMVKKYNVDEIELEVQSTNSYILKRCGYTYNLEDIKRVTKLLKWNRLKVSFQVGIGLPDSTRIDELNTAKALSKLRPNLVRIYPMVVLSKTNLEKDYKAKKFEPLTLNQAIERCKEAVYAFNKHKVKNINIVKENELNKSEETEIIAGPYHDEFAWLVTDSIWYDSIVDKIKKCNTKVKEVIIEVNPKDLPNILGYERENANKLLEMYDVEIKAEGNPKIKIRKIKVECCRSIFKLM